jgi:hypothetical protein
MYFSLMKNANTKHSHEAGASARYCGRLFSLEEIAWIRLLIEKNPTMNRAQLSRSVCEHLGWLKPDGDLKQMSCRVAMLRMHRDGLLSLPCPKTSNGNGHNLPRITSASDPKATLSAPAGSLGELSFQQVLSRKDSAFWNELIHRYHYLGYMPLPGAQIRYLIWAGPHLLAAMGFGAAAWALEPRDEFIGWSADQRKHNLHLVVNNARFLILPWIQSKHLASRILATAARLLPRQWQARYGYKPVLLESFILSGRFQGTCYRAANWHHVGQTQGRGKLDRYNRYAVPVKEIFLYPLHQQFRAILCSCPSSRR